VIVYVANPIGIRTDTSEQEQWQIDKRTRAGIGLTWVIASGGSVIDEKIVKKAFARSFKKSKTQARIDQR
jgi:hypothetical protein